MKSKYGEIDDIKRMTVGVARDKGITAPFVAIDVNHSDNVQELLGGNYKYVLVYEPNGEQLLHRKDEYPVLRIEGNRIMWLHRGTAITVLKGELRYCL